jgi:hypothetical protein
MFNNRRGKKCALGMDYITYIILVGKEEKISSLKLGTF